MIPCWLPDTVTTDLDRIVSRALLWGIEALELRSIGGAMQRVPDVNEARLRRRLDESEMSVEAIVPGLFEGSVNDRPATLNDLERLEDSIRFCGRIGCARIVVSAFSDPDTPGSSSGRDALRKAGDRVARAGLKLVVLNEEGMAVASGTTLARWLAEVDHPAVGAAYDLSLDTPDVVVSALAELAGRLDMIRLSGVESATPALLREAAATGYRGPVSIVMPHGTSGRDGLAMATKLVAAVRVAGQKVTPR